MKIKTYFVKIKDILLKLYKTNKKLFLLVICLSLVLIFLFLGKRPDNKNLNNNSNSNVSSPVIEINVNDYEKMLENKIEEMLLGLNSISNVKVMVVCESSVICNYLKDVVEQGSSGSVEKKEETVFEKNGSASAPILVSTDMPKVLGVLICVNQISPSTKLSIINSVSVVLNIDQSRISILQE